VPQTTEAPVAPAVEPGTSPPRRSRWVARIALFVVLAAVYFALPNSEVADSMRNVSIAESIVHRHTIALDHFRDTMPTKGYGVDEVNGHLLPYFPWGGSLFAVPVVAGYDALHKLGVGPGTEAKIAQSGQNDWEFEVFTMALVVAATAVVMWEVAILALAGIVDERRRRLLALLAALLFAFGTSALSTASRSYWEHGPDIFFLSIALLIAVRSRTRPDVLRWLGIPLAFAYEMRPTSSIPVVLFTLWMVVKHRRYLPWYLGGAAVVALPWLLVNHANWGSWLQPYYAPQRAADATKTFWEALAGQMVSPARGLLVFTPVLALAIPGVIMKVRWRRFDSLDAVLVACVLAHWLLISLFPHWWAGDSYGPRLFTDMVPFLVYLSLPVLEWLGSASLRGARYAMAMVACVLAALLSLFIHGQMAVFASSHCWNNVPSDVDRDTTKLWNWGDPQFLRGIVR
jgi:hypothetical protein